MSSRFLILTLLLVLAGPVRSAEPARPGQLVGYTELQTNLPGGRHANVRTMRAMIVNADGTGRRLLAEDLVHEPDAWTQFAGWSPDGKTAVIGRGWQSPENAQWESQHGQFRFTPEGWLLDSYLHELATGQAINVTAVERVSFYNGGLFFWPSDSTKLGFTALIDGNSHPFRMDRDGQDKVDLTKESKEFAYGFSSSRDGQRIAYHKNYQVFLAHADGSHAFHVETGQPFNFRRPGHLTDNGCCFSAASTTTVIHMWSVPTGRACASWPIAGDTEVSSSFLTCRTFTVAAATCRSGQPTAVWCFSRHKLALTSSSFVPRSMARLNNSHTRFRVRCTITRNRHPMVSG